MFVSSMLAFVFHVVVAAIVDIQGAHHVTVRKRVTSFGEKIQVGLKNNN